MGGKGKGDGETEEMSEKVKRLGLCNCCLLVGTSEKEPLKMGLGFIENESGLYFAQIDYVACCMKCREKIYLKVLEAVNEIRNDPERGK